MLAPQRMTMARAFLASASFKDSMLFAGGKYEYGSIVTPTVVALNQVDFFYLLPGSNGTIFPVQNLTTPRFDLSGTGLSVFFEETVFAPTPLLAATQTFTAFFQVFIRYLRRRH